MKVTSIKSVRLAVASAIISASTAVGRGGAPPPPPPDATEQWDQAMPLDALEKLSNAIQTGDHTAVAECICDDGVDPEAAAAARAFLMEQASLCRLKQAWQDKFRGTMNPSGINLYCFPQHTAFEVVLSGTVNFPKTPDAKIDGKMARMRVPLPREVFVEADPRQRNAALGHWSGAMLVFKNVEGNWKLDTDRTFNFWVEVFARQAGNDKTDMAIFQKVTEGLGDGIDAIAADIESGKITTSRQAITAINAAWKRACIDAHGAALAMPLPIIGG